MTVTRDDIHEIEMELTGQCNLSCYICTRNFVHSQHLIKTNIRPIEEITK
jgi:molybdenum cofactor biosynthesis enzyme MoaA